MINLCSITNKNNKEHNEKWPYNSEHPYRWFWISKNKRLIHLINKQNDIDKSYLYGKDLSESKYEFLIKKHQNLGIKHLNNPNAFTECSNTMDDVYENINDYNPIRKRKKINCL